MIATFPEPKTVLDRDGATDPFASLVFDVEDIGEVSADEVVRIAEFRLSAFPELLDATDGYRVEIRQGDAGEDAGDKQSLFREQGYVLDIGADAATLYAQERAGLVNGLSTLKSLIAAEEAAGNGTRLPLARIVDHPSIPVRAVAPTFSWYAGYGRMGFDMQLWGRDEWVDYLQHCLDNKINQLNMVLYGYWPFEVPGYPETVYRDIPMQVWNQETGRFLDISFSHPNVADDFLGDFIDLAHTMGVAVFAYVGLNSYNGGWTIAHPDKRMVPPAGSDFLNDFDSACLSDEETTRYILECMRHIARLGFDGYTLEESEEGFWFCECDRCLARWRSDGATPGEAKHRANIELLHQIRTAVREINPDVVIGIRAFRQPPLIKDEAWLRETAASLPSDVVLFWAPALYVPETEFGKWVDAFGKERIWGRDSESNSITSTMGRLYRTFESNLIRYGDEANTQTIERDIEQHIGSVAADVHGINGYVFEWHGIFLHQWAHGNYGWGSTMEQDRFFDDSMEATFGADLGARLLSVMRDMVTIHESQIPLYTTPFPFQANTMTDDDIPAIQDAIARHEPLLAEIRELRSTMAAHPRHVRWVKHLDRLENAQRRNRAIYDLVLAALDYERATDPVEKDGHLDAVLAHNERDFDIAKEMFFDLNPVDFTGVKSCMMPYHELKRLVHNLRHPEDPDDAIICSGIEALGWLWLAEDKS